MEYKVVTYLGDFPVEHQPLWIRRFASRKEAIELGRTQHDIMLNQQHEPKYWLYTVVQDESGDKVYWIIHNGKEIHNIEEATKLADKLGGE
jgi:hypothetical protein